MNERPIIFSGPMVRAILEGRKTQTRRVLAKQPTSPATIFTGIPEIGSLHQFWAIWPSPTPDENGHHPDDACKFPYGFVGDRLWVRETHSIVEGCRDHTGHDPICVYYKADQTSRYYDFYSHDFIDSSGYFDQADIDVCGGGWKPSIHMPRWASRLTMEITGVRVERLNKISDGDIKAEGVNLTCEDGRPLGQAFWQDRFIHLWDEINGKKHSWESNPWVWVIEFKKVNPGDA